MGFWPRCHQAASLSNFMIRARAVAGAGGRRSGPEGSEPAKGGSRRADQTTLDPGRPAGGPRSRGHHAGGRAVFVFLSYAEEDREIAAEISAWLGEQGVERFNWLTSGSGRFLPLIEGAISRADAFLALMSPHFMASRWCSRERDLALLREQQLQEDDPGREFVHVLETGTIRPEAAGFLGSYNWLSFTSPSARDDAFDELARRLGLARRHATAGPSAPVAGAAAAAGRPRGASGSPPPGGPPRHGSPPGDGGLSPDGIFALPPFRNREREFDLVEAGLVSGEKPFWLVTAPPQLGKSWFLKRARTRLEGLS